MKMPTDNGACSHQCAFPRHRHVGDHAHGTENGEGGGAFGISPGGGAGDIYEF